MKPDQDTVHSPKQRVVVLSEFCTHVHGSDCSRCLACCPHNAISLPASNEAPRINHHLCSGCGICFGVCDAFASTRLSLLDLHARLLRIAQGGQRAYLTCKENVFPGFTVDSHVVVLPCLSMVPPELWTLLLAEGVRITIACDLKYCEDCERAGNIGGDLFGRAIEIAEERTGEKVLFTFRIPEKQKLIEKYADNGTTERRAMFEGFAADAANIVSGKRRLRNSNVLKDYYERKERQKAAMRLHLASENPYPDFKPDGARRSLMFPKQQLILDTVKVRPDVAEKIPVALSVTDESICCGQGNCAASCPTGARIIENGCAQVLARLCIGCGICVDTCDMGACSIEENTASIYLSSNHGD